MVKKVSENGTDICQDDMGSMEETPEDTILARQNSVNLVPFIGQRFISQDSSYEFFCSFAKQCGFQLDVTVLMERMEFVEESREDISPAIAVVIHR